MLNKISASQLLKTDNILTVNPNASLSQALARLRSSHDAVFVVQGDKVLGLISPYHALFHANTPAQTKVKHCLFSPPKLRPHTKLPEIARQMIESKVYYLPVFDEGDHWLGIVTKGRVLETLRKNPQPEAVFASLFKPKRLTTVTETTTLGEARNLMKASGVSRLIVANGTGVLRGLLTRHDLRTAFSSPESSQNFLSRDGDKIKASRQEIRPYIKKHVITARHNDSFSKILALLIESNIGSVVLVNPKYQPTDIISVRDILKVIATQRDLFVGKLQISGDALPKSALAVQLLRQSFTRLHKKDNHLNLDALVKVEKNAQGLPSRYSIGLTAKHLHSPRANTKSTSPDWQVALRQAIKKIEAQM